MSATVVIPARFGSTRFPGKVLADDTGRPLIQHVYEQATRADGSEAVHRAMLDDASLGVTGGMYHEVENGRSLLAGRAYGDHVPGPAQVFRREVFDQVEGYQPWEFGGDDVVSVTRATPKSRMRTASSDDCNQMFDGLMSR